MVTVTKWSPLTPSLIWAVKGPVNSLRASEEAWSACRPVNITPFISATFFIANIESSRLSPVIWSVKLPVKMSINMAFFANSPIEPTLTPSASRRLAREITAQLITLLPRSFNLFTIEIIPFSDKPPRTSATSVSLNPRGSSILLTAAFSPFSHKSNNSVTKLWML